MLSHTVSYPTTKSYQRNAVKHSDPTSNSQNLVESAEGRREDKEMVMNLPLSLSCQIW